METPFAQYPPDTVDEAVKEKAKKPWVLLGCVAASAFLVGIFSGIGIGEAPVKDLKSQVAYEKTRVESLVAKNEADLSAAKAEVAVAEESAASREGELDTRVEELEAREAEAAELQASLEAEVASREANTFGAGMYEVGTDIEPGKYKTSGPNGQNSAGCYYAWKSSVGSDADIVDNELTKGKATVVLKKGQVFEVGACEDFVKQ